MIRYLIIFALMLITSTPLVSKAETEKALSTFATIPILNEGRIKPLDSFARAKLKTFSGRESLPDISPIEWLIEGLFDPAAANQRPLIKIRNPELISALTLEDKYLHSFEELLPKLNAKKEIILELLRKPETEWTQSQSDLVLLQQKMAMFEQLFGSLSPLLPLRIDVPPDAPDYLKPFTGTNITYRDILKFQEQLDADLKKIISKKGDDITKYSSLEQTLAFISFAANQLKGKGKHNKIFKVLPTGDNQAFLSPWEVLTQGGTPNTAGLTILWAQLAQTENIPDWNKLVANINAQTVSLSGIPQTRINVEYAYNLLHPHDASLALYIFCLILATTSILLNKQWIMRISGFFLFSGVLVHITGITARIYILSRPPRKHLV